MKSRPPLILASLSPRRRQLLRRLKIPFRVIPSHASEESNVKNPRKLVMELALRKASSVAKELDRGLVLGADTIVVLGGRILGKPGNTQDAYRMLYRLSGSTHSVYTGIALVDAATGRSKSAVAASAVRMKKLPIDRLLALSRNHLDKAGAYAIQEKKDPIARVIRGSYDNVVGLPVSLVKKLLKQF
ncbi:MAG: Maf family protein [Elusimicrobiota bacterium]|jgi:septum formation protein